VRERAALGGLGCDHLAESRSWSLCVCVCVCECVCVCVCVCERERETERERECVCVCVCCIEWVRVLASTRLPLGKSCEFSVQGGLDFKFSR
jgi:hypothetical protein